MNSKYHTIDDSFSESKKERIEILKQTEWERWTPIVGLARMFEDHSNKDSVLLKKMHSKTYNIANKIYNTSVYFGSAIGLSYLL